MKNSKPHHDNSLRYICMTMAMEGMPLPDSEKKTISDCLSGKIKTSDVIAELLQKIKAQT
jgi:hypothetical protein